MAHCKYRKRLAPLLVLLLVACGCARPNFNEFSLARCGLVVQLPGEPKEDRGVAFNHTRYTARAGNSTYVVSCHDFAANLLMTANADHMLAAAVQRTMNDAGATLDSQMIIEFDGNPGRDFEGSKTIDGQHAVVRARAYLVGNHLVQTTVLGVRGQMSAADVETYLDSLKLLK
jgi:hypothetical protein